MSLTTIESHVSPSLQQIAPDMPLAIFRTAQQSLRNHNTVAV